MGRVSQPDYVEIAASDSFSDDDSLLDRIADLDIHTPPTSPSVIKGASPLSTVVELHPQACLCQVCTNPSSLLHTAKLVVQCSSNTILKTKDKLQEDCTSSENGVNLSISAAVSLISSTCTSLKDMIKNRVQKCDQVLENVGERLKRTDTSGGVVDGCGQTKSSSGGKGSSRSTVKGAPRKTKKSSKSIPRTSEESATSLSVSHAVEFLSVMSDVATTLSECWLLEERPKEAMKEIETAILKLRGERGGDSTDKEWCLVMARLHYQMGVACVQEVELSRPEVVAQLWEELGSRETGDTGQSTDSSAGRTRARSKSTKKTTTRKPRSTASKASSAKKVVSRDFPLSRALEHFLTCYQLCFPNLPALMTREVCQWVGLLLRGRGDVGGAEEMTAHFVNMGMNCTLTHQTIYCLGKKFRFVGVIHVHLYYWYNGIFPFPFQETGWSQFHSSNNKQVHMPSHRGDTMYAVYSEWQALIGQRGSLEWAWSSQRRLHLPSYLVLHENSPTSCCWRGQCVYTVHMPQDTSNSTRPSTHCTIVM